jgi:hypothetical protein
MSRTETRIIDSFAWLRLCKIQSQLRKLDWRGELSASRPDPGRLANGLFDNIRQDDAIDDIVEVETVQPIDKSSDRLIPTLVLNLQKAMPGVPFIGGSRRRKIPYQPQLFA